ncbi:MAG: hypothetical protein ABW022_03190 [Actinoplanes sp.]
MSSQHRHTNRNYRPADDEYDPAKAAIEKAGFNVNVAIRAFFRWIIDDPRRLRQLVPFMKAVADETPKGRPKRSEAPPK